MKTAIQWRLLGTFALALVILTAVGVLTYRNTMQVRALRAEVRRTRELAETAQRYISDAEKAETEQRGYILTGSDEFLPPRRAALTSLAKDLERLNALSRDDGQRRIVQELRTHTKTKTDEMEATIALRRSRGSEAARQAFLSGAGNREMDEMRARAALIRDTETQRLQAEREQYEISVEKKDRFAMETMLVQFALLALVFYFIHRDAKYRAQSAFEILRGNMRLSAILATMGEGLFQINRSGKLVYLNPAGENLLGYQKDEILGKSMHELVHGDHSGGKACSKDDCALRTANVQSSTSRSSDDSFERKDGVLITVEYVCTPLVQYGEINGAVVVFRDVTQRNRLAHALQESEERYRNLVDKSRGLICTHDMDGLLISVNEASAEALGYLPEELQGRNMREFLIPKFRHKFDWYLKALSEWGSHSGLMRVITKDGEELVWSYSNRIIQEPGARPYVLGHAHDVTSQILTEEALKVSEEKLQVALEKEQNMARIDFLTKVPNRRTFWEGVDTEAKRSRRYGRPMTLAYVDLDNFKQVNDIYGHQVGDDLLRAVAVTMHTIVRSTDLVARLGGDEFALLLPETNGEAANIVVNKIQAALLKAVEEHNWPVTFSFGVVTFNSPLDSVDEMIKRADDLMYEVKRGGKSAVVAEVV